MTAPARDLYGSGLEDTLPPPEAVGQPQLTRHTIARKTVTDQDVRCQGLVVRRDLPGQPERVCGKLLAEIVGRPWRIRCVRCRNVNVSPPDSSG